MSHFTPGPWKTGREDMQSYTGDGQTAFTNIYHATEKDGMHLGHPLPLTIGRAEGKNNKANARLIAASPELLDACMDFIAAMNDGAKSKALAACLRKTHACVAKATEAQ